MSHFLFSACVAAVFVSHAAFAQTDLTATSGNIHESTTEAVTAQATPASIAYVYVSNTVNQIVGYSASSTGKLTAIPGSPFKAIGGASMAVNGKYLFGEGNSNIYSSRIASNWSVLST